MGREENPLQMEGSKEQGWGGGGHMHPDGRIKEEFSNPKTTCSSSYGMGGGGQEGPSRADPLGTERPSSFHNRAEDAQHL